jgi:hypothetical protein
MGLIMMKAIDFISKREHRLVWWSFATVIILSTITVFVVGAYNRDLAAWPVMKPHQAALVSSQPPPASRLSTMPQSDDVPDAISLTLYRQGFEKGEIAITKGRFVLEVLNRTGLGSITLSLRSQNGASLRQAQVQREQPQWADMLDLPPGEYVLSVGEHAEWNCKITVGGR